MASADRLIETFDEAKGRPAGAERERFLAETCRDDPELMEQVVSLLQAHEVAGGFLKHTILFPPFLITEKPGDLIGRYKLLEKVGEGGCGVVYVAEQTEPVRRRVALKVIKLGMDTKQVVARFEAERQALAMMDHPNIAKVLDAGSTETGRPYFVMDLVRGISITDFCEQNNFSTSERLDLFIKVCQSIQHAHQKGIIHRDIKPSNILVTLHDGIPVPKVIDFGIAKATEGRLTDATVYTQLLHFIGTPAYMSPEQTEMSGLDIDTRSDIYSLGVLLYELLTGKTPFDGQKLMASGIDAMRRTIREREPPRPSTRLTQELVAVEATSRKATSGLAVPTQDEVSADSRRRLRLREQIHRVRGDLDWIVMKCLEKNRTRRYETANGLAADLQRHLSNELVTARPPSTAYKLHKAWRRNKLAVSATAAVALALLVGISLSAWQGFVASRAQKAAEHQLYVASMNLAGQAWEENNYGMVRQLLTETRAFSERRFEWYYCQRQTHLNLLTLRAHTELVTSVAFFPDGRRIVTGSGDKSARVWNVVTGRELLTLLGHKSAVNSVAVSPDGKQIATASSDGTVIVWDSSSGRKLQTLEGHRGGINALAFSPDGQRIATGSSDGICRVWKVAAREVVVTLAGHTNSINSVAFSPDGEKVVTGSDDRTARVWRSTDGMELFPLLGHEREILAVAFSPDGQRILTGSIDPIARFWNATTGAALPLQLETKDPIIALAFSQDGRRIVTGSWSSTARVWNATNGQIELLIRGHEKGLHSVAISPDGNRVITGGFDHLVKIWDANGGQEQLKIEGNATNSVLAIALSPDGQRIATASGILNNDGSVAGSGDQALQIWDMDTRKKLLTMDHDWGVSSVAFSPNGDRILSGSGDRTAKIWDAANGALLSTLKGHTGSVTSVAFFPKVERIVTGSCDRTARVWNSVTGHELFILSGHTNPISSVAVSPNGQLIATGSFDQTVRVWEAVSGQLVRIIPALSSRVYSVAFSPDSNRIAICGWGSPAVWDVTDARRNPITLQGHTTPITSVAFSPDGLRIVTGSMDQTVRVWEAATGRQLLTLRGHTRPVYAVATSPEGRRIVTGSMDQTVRIWEAATPKQVAAWETEERAAANSVSSR